MSESNQFRELARAKAAKDAATRRLHIVENGTSPAPLVPSADANQRRRYALGGLRKEADNVSAAPPGTRNHTLNVAAFNMVSLIDAGELVEDQVVSHLTAAAINAGLTQQETAATIRSGFTGGRAKVGARDIPQPSSTPSPSGLAVAGPNVHAEAAAAQTDVEKGRRVKLFGAHTVRDDVPTWAWEYGGKGRIQKGTLALFAGRPGAGKSSASRWFAAQVTRGLLDGCWFGQPQRVAYIAPAEESLQYIIKPGLRGVGADLSLIEFVAIEQGDEEMRLLSLIDEKILTEAFLAAGITVIIVDPLMSTIGANVDIHRNNETRAYVEPWARMADALAGVALGVVHLRKDTSGDPVAAINGSSAFGEVARAVFGFAKDPQSDEGVRVMSQAKNSAGHEDFAVTYQIGSTVVTTDAGAQAEVGTFEITGDSAVTVGEVMNAAANEDHGALAEAMAWLEDYLREQGRSTSQAVKNEARKVGISDTTVKRAARRLGVVVASVGFPRVTVWDLQPGQ